MALHIYHTCDRCGERLPDNYLPLCITVDRVPDAAGSMVNVTEQLDLCQNCLVTAVFNLLDGTPFGKRAEFAKWVKSKLLNASGGKKE